ncbi:hypothetical protein EDB83DRAFT_2325138 [Lactarius deliciosus]|nr:hypothetical protein EDB83DRAFT_2325138 [Lactarius deliciosus]
MPLAPARALLGRSSVWLVLLPIGATVGTRRFYEAVNPNFDSVGLGKRKTGQGGSGNKEKLMWSVLSREATPHEQPLTHCLVDSVGSCCISTSHFPLSLFLGDAPLTRNPATSRLSSRSSYCLKAGGYGLMHFLAVETSSSRRGTNDCQLGYDKITESVE